LLYPVLVSPQYIESSCEFDPLENVLIFIENGCHKLGMPSHLYQLAWYDGRVQRAAE
jgi:hypothetical protein